MSCSKSETLLRRTDTFDPVCFLYAFLLRISNVTTVKRTLLQTNNFFQSWDKKAISLTPTQTRILGISEKQRIKLEILVKFVKKKHFLHLKTIIIYFLISYFSLSAMRFSQTLYLFFLCCSLQPTNSCFISLKAISDKNLQTILHPSMSYWFQYCDLH